MRKSSNNSTRVDRLLNGLQRLCQSSEGLVAWWQRLRQDFAEFAELLEEHEAAENNLLTTCTRAHLEPR